MFQIIFETVYILGRTFVFVLLVVNYPKEAINAFSIAQMFSSVLLCALYYGFFAWYIPKLNEIKAREEEEIRSEKDELFSDMSDFPFRSILNFFPGFMFNEV